MFASLPTSRRTLTIISANHSSIIEGKRFISFEEDKRSFECYIALRPKKCHTRG